MLAGAMARAIEETDGLSLRGFCTTPRDMASACAGGATDLGVLDLELYDGDGGLAVASLREHAICARSLLLTSDLTPQFLDDALLAGADNCISARVDCHAFLAAVRATLVGKLMIAPECAVTLRAVLANQTSGRLSDRELEVLRLAAVGMSVADVGARMCISVHTANKHLARAYRKLVAHNRCGAVAIGRRLGFL